MVFDANIRGVVLCRSISSLFGSGTAEQRICLTWVTYSTRLFIMLTHGNVQSPHIAFLQIIEVPHQILAVQGCQLLYRCVSTIIVMRHSLRA